MKVIVVGIPYFASKIAKNLTAGDGKNAYLAIDASAGAWQKIRYVWHMISAKVLYQVGGSNICGGTLRLAMLLNKQIVMHWVGTDVLNMQEAYKVGDVDADLIRRTKHLCEVDWVQKELLDVGIQAEIAQIACFTDEIPTPPPFPKIFSILSYMGKGREKFYGIDKLIDLAQSFPDIPIRIAGISQYSAPLPSNIELLGWVNDMVKEYRDCVLFLRLPEHDGLSFSVLEALSYGRYVGYTYSFRGTYKIADMSELRDLVQSMSELHSRGLLGLNNDGHKFIVECYLSGTVMRSLIETITRHAYYLADI
jgi:hypothetical protein